MRSTLDPAVFELLHATAELADGHDREAGVARGGVVVIRLGQERLLRVPKMREQATVHAFGAKAVRINREQRKQRPADTGTTPEKRIAAD